MRARTHPGEFHAPQSGKRSAPTCLRYGPAPSVAATIV